jgi:hypothetical protein
MSDVNTLGLGLLGFALPVLALGGLLLRSPRHAKWVRLAPFALTAASAALAWALGLWLAPVVLAALAGLFLAAGSAAAGRLLDRVRGALSRTQVQWGALLLAGPALAVAWVCVWQSELPAPWEGPPPDTLVAPTPADLRPVKVAHAVTDAGKPVALYRPATRLSAQELAQYEQRLIKNLAGEVISTRPGGPESNCHGWVFTGGRYWVPSEEVDRIVKDNGYRPVPRPRAGDLVVYREPDGKVIHSGVVRFVDEDGQPLVESKWGLASRFLHPADRHCYAGSDAVFYRSARPGHHLQGLDSPGETSPETAPLVSQGAVRDPEHGAEAKASAEAHGAAAEADAD